MTEDKLTRMLGWASAVLRAPLLMAADRSARAIGIDDGPRQRAAVAGVGARELIAAAGLLGQRRPAWLWTRVAVRNEGEVRFMPAPGGNGAEPDTEVHVRLSYSVPAAKLGTALARHFGEDPRQQLDDDLRRFKQVPETGEVIRSEGAPWGKRVRHEFPQHPARPLTAEELTEVRS